MQRTFRPLALALALLAVLTAGAPAAFAQEVTPLPVDTMALGDALPVDPDVRTGVLDNGLRYYIRRNTEPTDRAELRLAVDAGSILETDEQRGLAHFLEHMLFNGTCRFPEQDLVNFLERTGMRFGPDVNAYTSFDETVYMLTVPTDSAEIVSKAFDVLQDWASCATLSDEEIDKERGVVIEEWRLSDQNAQGRIRDQILPVLLPDSHYQERLPIGKPEVIRNASYEQVRSFYRDWYRPELMAVVAVGDFDPDHIEALIQEHFAGLENPAEPAPRPSFAVPGHEETLYKVATDPEQPYTTVTVYYKKDAEATETVGDYRANLVSSLFNSLLNARFAEIAREPNAPYVGAQVFRGGFVRPAEFYGLGAQVQNDSVLVGLEALLTEAARVRAHGFTETELARHKAELLRSYQQAFAERENTNSAAYAQEYVGNFLEAEPIPGIRYEYAMARQYVPDVTLDEINERAAALLAEENRAVVVTMPEKEGVTVPTEAALAGVLEAVEEKEIDPYVDDVSDQPLVAHPPAPAAVTAERAIPELGVTELTLANGVRVVLKPTDFKQDEVRFTAFSPGGSSLAPEDRIFEADMAANLVAASGVGAFTETELQKLLAGQVVSVSPYIGELEEGFSGSASPEDLETLFQLIHLYVTEPRADSTALAALQNQLRAVLANRAENPMGVFQDSLQAALYGGHPRRTTPTLAMVDSLDLQEAFALYRDRFADADDFTFVFAGNFDVARVTELARQYLGTLPTSPREEQWRDVYPALPEGVVEETVRKGVGQRSQTLLLFHGPFDYTREHRHHLRAMADVLNIMLREELREDLGGVYGVSVSASPSAAPDSTYQVAVSYGSAPERVDELVDAVYRVVEKLQTEGPSADDLAKVKEQHRRERETALETNNFWVGVLDYYYQHPEEDVLDVLRYTELVEALTAEDVQQAARQYLDRDDLVRAVLYPETAAATGAANE